jgi:hypothetical protein
LEVVRVVRYLLLMLMLLLLLLLLVVMMMVVVAVDGLVMRVVVPVTGKKRQQLWLSVG